MYPADHATAIQNLDLSYNTRDLIAAINDLVTSSRSQTFQYDELGRLTRGTGVYGAIDYAYDAVGNRTQRTVTTGGAVVHDYAYSGTSIRLNTVP